MTSLSAREPLESAEQFEALYDRLLAQTIQALPSTRIVLGEPFVLPVGKHKATWEADRIAIGKRQEAVARLAAKYHLSLIHYQRAFGEACKLARAEHWSWDGIHPNHAGHALMAREWLRTEDEFWRR